MSWHVCASAGGGGGIVSTHSQPRQYKGVGSQHHATANFTPETKRYPSYRRLRWSGRARKTCPNRIRFPKLPARSKSLHRLHYPGRHVTYCIGIPLPSYTDRRLANHKAHMITVKPRIQGYSTHGAGFWRIICATTDQKVRASDHVATLIEEVTSIRELIFIHILYYDISYNSKDVQLPI
jgi:hypothetical protein